MLFSIFTRATLVTLTIAGVIPSQEQHTISFVNKCGYGTPTLIQGGKSLLDVNQTTYTHTGDPFETVIAYLQTKDHNNTCLLNGEGCILIEMNLANSKPDSVGCGSFVDLSRINPHTFNAEVSIMFTNGNCTGTGARCSKPTCKTAYLTSDDDSKVKSCHEDNANVEVTFCGGYSWSAFLPEQEVTKNVTNPQWD